jgi:hypothetical protein
MLLHHRYARLEGWPRVHALHPSFDIFSHRSAKLVLNPIRNRVMNARNGSGGAMARQQVTIAVWLACGLMAAMSSAAGAMPSPLQVEGSVTIADADAGLIRLAQAAPAQPAAPAPTADAAAVDPIGNVATLTGSATVTRNSAATPLKLKDDVFKNDVLQTSANSTLGVTFNDETTFHLTANARITVDNYVYEDGGSKNAALFNIARGTVAFVASAVARTGDMKIETPTATLGIRGTTGLVDVPEGAAAAGQNNVAIKLYPDPDGRVGHIDVNGRDGTRLGSLSQGATGFAIRPGVGAGMRFAAVPLAISPQQAARDRGIVQQVHAAQAVGRQIVTQRRATQRNNPGRQPGAPRPNALPPRNAPPAQPRPPELQKQGRPGPIRPALPQRPAAKKRPPQQRR